MIWNLSREFKLVTLDLDGTMFQGNSVLYLKDRLALSEDVAIPHEKFGNGEITEKELNYLQIPLLKGIKLSPILKILSGGPLLRNIKEGVHSMHEAGVIVSMLTFNPLQVLFEREFGIDTSICKSVEIVDDEISRVNEIPDNKINYLERYCKSNRILLEECIHVGDGPNDIPTFRAVGFSIALNSGWEIVRRAAGLSIETDDFSVVSEEILKSLSA